MGKDRPTSDIRRIRNLMWKRDRGRCYWCERVTHLNAATGTDIPDHLYATLDHILPRHRGGTLRRDNVLLSCWECNTRRGDMGKGKFKRFLNKEKANHYK